MNRRQFLASLGLGRSSIGALAGRFDILLGINTAPVPVITITNTTDPVRSGAFRSGENWRPDLWNASAAARVYLHLWKENQDLGISGPYGSLTDSNGAWTLSESYGVADTGSWQLQAVIGTLNSAETSAPIALRVERFAN